MLQMSNHISFFRNISGICVFFYTTVTETKMNPCVRACLKNAFWHMYPKGMIHRTLQGTKWGVQMLGMIFQTRSGYCNRDRKTKIVCTFSENMLQYVCILQDGSWRMNHKKWSGMPMKLKNALIVVEDVETSVLFYRELFGLQVVSRKEGNVIMTEGLCLQERRLWEELINETVSYQGRDASLYFQERDLDSFEKKLADSSFEIRYISGRTINDWGKQVIRIYDPDGHVIEISET